MKRTKRIAGAASTLLWVAVALSVCYGATRLGLGGVTEPGSGFIFFWSGLILAVLSLIAFAESRRSEEEATRPTGALNWRKIVLVLFALVLYGFFLERLGFMLTTFLLLSFFLGLIEGVYWRKSLAVAAGAAFGAFAIFELWLKIRLPHGIFGF